MYKHIIWDFDGTLFDSYPTMALAAKNAMEEEGIYESYDAIMSMIKISLTRLYDYFDETYTIRDTLVSNFTRLKRELEADSLKPFPDAVEVCRSIHLNKGFNHLYTHRGESSVKYLEKFGMLNYFSGLVTRENNFKRKPDPEALMHLIEEYNIDTSEALMIGDRDIDILAAKNAGIAGCYYKSYSLYNCEYARYTITDYKQLLEILELK